MGSSRAAGTPDPELLLQSPMHGLAAPTQTVLDQNRVVLTSRLVQLEAAGPATRRQLELLFTVGAPEVLHAQREVARNRQE